jgi:hypothetical protein
MLYIHNISTQNLTRIYLNKTLQSGEIIVFFFADARVPISAGLEESIFVTLDAAGDDFVGSHLAYVQHEPPDADRRGD